MTKEYVSTQRYKAFYWDGSNVDELREWLDELGVTWSKKLNFDCQYIDLSLDREGWWSISIVSSDNDSDSVEDVKFLRECTPEYVVIGKDFLSVDLWTQETFDNWFKEVKK